jgi:hypothetical protein
VANKKSIKDYFLIVHKVITYTFRTIGSIGVIGILVITTLVYSRHKYWEFTILSLVMLVPFLYFMFLFRIRYFFIGLSFCCSSLAFLHFTNFTDEKKLYALYKQITPNMSIEEFEALKESYFPNEKINKVLKTEIIKDLEGMRIKELEALRKSYLPNEKINKGLKTKVIKDSKYEEKGSVAISYWIRQHYKINKVGETITTGDGLIITVNKGKITDASGPEFMD